MAEEQVNHPEHYNKGRIEVIDFIDDQYLNFNRGNAVKYICRAHKGEITSLEKAIWYLQRELGRAHGVIETKWQRDMDESAAVLKNRLIDIALRGNVDPLVIEAMRKMPQNPVRIKTSGTQTQPFGPEQSF